MGLFAFMQYEKAINKNLKYVLEGDADGCVFS